MVDTLLLLLALAINLMAMAALALAMPQHWRQLSRQPLSAAEQRRLRLAGGMGLLLALGLCLHADHPSMAALVWVMMQALSIVVIALLLAGRAARR